MDQARLSDKDIATDLLNDIKEMALGYHLATMEAANMNVRNTFFNHHSECVKQQKELFDTMQARGWYQVQPAQGGMTQHQRM